MPVTEPSVSVNPKIWLLRYAQGFIHGKHEAVPEFDIFAGISLRMMTATDRDVTRSRTSSKRLHRYSKLKAKTGILCRPQKVSVINLRPYELEKRHRQISSLSTN